MHTAISSPILAAMGRARLPLTFGATSVTRSFTLASAAVVLALVTACAAPSQTAGPTRPAPSQTVTSTAAADYADVPRIDGCKLLTDDEVEAGLGLLDIAWVDRLFQINPYGESCTWTFIGTTNVAPAGQVLQIAPGEASDFEPGATLDGHAGTAVPLDEGAAVWFAVPTGGVLSVGQSSDLGFLFYRVGVTRPDLDDAARLAVATDLALAALARFPGLGETDSEPQATEPATSNFDRTPPDTSKLSYADNLLARERAGDWTLGDGLVAALKLFAGETDAASVLSDPDILDPSSADVIAMAHQYLIDGPDGAARDEIARLLDELTFRRAELEAASGGPEALQGAWPAIQLASVIVPQVRARAGLNDPCTSMGHAGTCLREYHPSPLETLDAAYGSGKYKIYVIADANDFGWYAEQLWTAEALRDAALMYEALGNMPASVSVVITSFKGSRTQVDSRDGECSLNVNIPMLQLAEGQFKQWLAADLADCFIAATFPTQAAGSSTARSWWRRALALYLSNVVYPAPQCDFGKGLGRCDLEWAFATTFASQETTTNLVNRTEANWLFFQHLEQTEGVPGILQLISSLPAGNDAAAHQASLAAYGSMAELFHDFAKSVSDTRVRDTGGGWAPVSPEKNDLVLTCNTSHSEQPQPFDTVRLQLSVSGGESAFLDYALSGDISVSWRPGTAGGSGVAGNWSGDLPTELSDDAVMVITSTQPGAHFLVWVKDLDPSCDPTPPPPASPPDSSASGAPVTFDCGCDDQSHFYLRAVGVSVPVQEIILHTF